MNFNLKNLNLSSGGGVLEIRKVEETNENRNRSTFSRYTQKSSMHGIKYVGNEKLHWSGRVLWLILIATMGYMCGHCIYKFFTKIGGVAITFDDEYTPISSIPFPSVTLCDPIIVNPKVFNYSDILGRMEMEIFTGINCSLSVEELQNMYSVAGFCDRYHARTISTYNKFCNNTPDRNIWPHLQHLSPNMWNTSGCFLDGDTHFACEEYGFRKFLSNQGICYTFNSRDSQEIFSPIKLADDFPKYDEFSIEHTWNLNNFKFPHISRKISFPYYVDKKIRGLSFAMQFNEGPDRDYDPVCNTPIDADHIKLFIHTPEGEFTANEVRIPLDHYVKITVTPNRISTDEYILRNVKQARRKCVDGENEKEYKLNFFHYYSKDSCHYDSIIKGLLDSCGCVLFHMPRKNDTKICDAHSDRECLDTFYDISIHNIAPCLPSCNSTIYEIQTVTEKFEKSSFSRLEVQIKFGKEEYLFKKRKDFYGEYDFITDIGANLGLFMGMSLLSVAEIGYHGIICVLVNCFKSPIAKKTSTETLKITLTAKRKRRYNKVRRIERKRNGSKLLTVRAM